MAVFSKPMKVHFRDVFQILSNGAFGPKVPVHVNGVTMTPGVGFGPGVQFGGLDLSQIQAKFLEVDIQNGVYVVKGYYQE